MERATVVPIAIRLGGPRSVFSYLVRTGRPVIVDAGVPGQAPHILETLAAEGVDPREVALILITHGHTDHTGSMADLKEATGAPVAVQALDAPALQAGDSMPVVGRTPEAQRMVEEMAANRAERLLAMRPVMPDIVVDEARDLSDLGIPGRLLHTPGHTPGGLSMFLDTGDAFVGDLIGSDPQRPGLPDLPYFAADVPAMEESIRKVIAEEPAVVWTGHEGPFTLEQLRAAFG